MRGKLNHIKQKLASYIYIYIYIYRAARQRLGLKPGTSSKHSYNTTSIDTESRVFGSNSSRNSSFISHYIKSSRNLRIAGTIASILLLTISAFTIYPIAHKSNLAEAATGTASSTSLTITSDHPAANLDLVVRGSGGTFAESTTQDAAAFSVATNNVSGYELSIAGSDSTGQLTNVATSSTLDSIDSYTDAETFTNGSAALYNGKWGYKPSMYNSASNTYFRPAPTEGGSTLNITDSANTKKSAASSDTVNCDNYTCNDYTIALGARADITTKAGTYTNTFILTAVGNPVTYSIDFEDLSGDTSVANMPADISDVPTSSTEVNLPSTVPTRTKYTFNGWCNLPTTTQSDGSTTCSSTATVYNAGGKFGIDQTTTNNTTLYAIWKINAYDITIKTAPNITKVTLNGQECTSTSGCKVEGLIIGESYPLVATLATGYSFSSWSESPTGTGTFGSTTSASTTYTIGSGDSTITPAATINKYTCNKRYRLQNADGTWGSYTTDTSAQVDYNTTCTYTKSVTDYKNSASGTNGASATTSGTMPAGDITLSLDFYRNTYTLTVSKGTGINTASATTSAVHGSNYYRWGQAVAITSSLNTGYSFNNWTQSGTAGTFASATSSSTNFTMGKGNATVAANAKTNKYNITLTNTNATTSGSTSAYATYNSSSVYAGSAASAGTSTITAPQRKYTISGFSTSYNNASGATVSSTSSLTNSYTFNGWYTASSGGTRIITADGALVASTSYTNSSSQWTSTSSPTLYAQWGSGTSITLPTISKTGHTCGWGTSTSTSTITYASGYTGLVPTASMTLYGVCNAKTNLSLTVAFSAGVSSVAVKSGSASGTTVGTVTTNGGSVSGLTYGQNYYLVPSYTSGATLTWTQNSVGSGGTGLSSTSATTPYFNIGDGTNKVTLTAKFTITFKTSNASGIVFNGTTYTNNQTAQIAGGSYSIRGNYASRYAFSNWSVSGSGSFGNSAYQNTTFAVSGAATITLTGQSVSTSIQSITSSTCTTTAKPVYDTRDNEVYWIQKLADNKCWMLDNLRLGSTSTIRLSTSNTNSRSSWTLPKSGTVCLGDASGKYDQPCTGTSGATGTGYTVPAINSDSKNTTTTSYGSGSGKIGVYYNYCAASAGTYCSAYGSGTSNASYDICPKGWRMPTGGSSGEYQTLITTYNNGANLMTALSTPLAGYIDYYTWHANSYGKFWSSSYHNASTSIKGVSMWTLEFNEYHNIYITQGDRENGIPVRCLLK